jgi:hypothetical protein
MIAVVPQRVRPDPDPAPAASWDRSPVRGWVSAILAWLLILAAVPALGSAGPAPAVALSHRVEHLKAAFLAGDPEALGRAVQEVELLRRTYGTLDVIPLVDAMALFARQLGRQGRAGLGLQVLQTVDRWGHGDPILLGTRVVLLREQGLRGYLWSFADLVELTRVRLVHPETRWLWLVRHLAGPRLAATLLLWGWALVLVLRYRSLFRHLWEDPLLRRGWNPRVAAGLGAVLVTCPALLGLGPSPLAMLWLWLLAPVLLPAEVRITFLVVFLQWAQPALGLLEPLAAGQPRPSIVTLQLRPQPLELDPRVWAALAPPDRAFLTGWRQLQDQDWPRAEAAFKALAASHPDRDAVLNNLGVARFQQGDLAGAQACFDQAAALRPDSPEILLNQSVVAFREMDSSLGSARQEEASRAAPDSVERMVAANHSRKDQRTFALPLPDTAARSLAMAAASQGEDPRAGLAGPKGGLAVLGLMLPLAAALAIRWRLLRSGGAAHPCQCVRCGEPFHITASPDPQVCSKCHHLFRLKDALHGASRNRKRAEAAAFQKTQRRLHRMLQLLLPGADRCFLGDARAFLGLGWFCLALGIVWTAGRAVSYPGTILPDPASIWLPAGLALLAGLYLRSWSRWLPRRPRRR